MNKPRPKVAPTRESMEPYPCMCPTCKNKIKPTKLSRPWYCDDCTRRLRQAIIDSEYKRTFVPPKPKYRR